ncbi:hypothetical protein [Desulfogranum japonicum]|uniref:hypothetical protein n=1 Tax=Desulfogranum japonicum TaxID=231447 RepID=UPI00041B6E6A|nr:hypothetical protein [Desulfogranum japonicum]
MYTVYLTPVLFFASLALLWLVYHWLYKDYLVDRFRQRMFELRDELFDEAHNGLIDFNHPAYGVLRRTMNGSIRFAHELSVLQFFCTSICVGNTVEEKKEERYNFQREFSEAINTLDEPTKERILEYRTNINRLISEHLILDGLAFFILIAIILVIPALLAYACYRHVFSKMKSLINRELNALESTALSVGKL